MSRLRSDPAQAARPCSVTRDPDFSLYQTLSPNQFTGSPSIFQTPRLRVAPKRMVSSPTPNSATSTTSVWATSRRRSSAPTAFFLTPLILTPSSVITPSMWTAETGNMSVSIQHPFPCNLQTCKIIFFCRGAGARPRPQVLQSKRFLQPRRSSCVHQVLQLCPRLPSSL